VRRRNDSAVVQWNLDLAIVCPKLSAMLDSSVAQGLCEMSNRLL